jgi:hypothetical protein
MGSTLQAAVFGRSTLPIQACRQAAVDSKAYGTACSVVTVAMIGDTMLPLCRPEYDIADLNGLARVRDRMPLARQA